MKKTVLGLLAIILAFAIVQPASANPYEESANALANGAIKEFVNNPVVTNAVRAQNEKHATLSEEDIIALDQKWRTGDEAMIDGVLANDLSTYLKDVQQGGEGLYTEIFVMDNKGLNVGQSDKTSDYWQGDEAKWQKTYLVGAGSVHLSDIEEDESSQTFQMQISIPVVDGEEVIGAVTVGVDAEMLE